MPALPPRPVTTHTLRPRHRRLGSTLAVASNLGLVSNPHHIKFLAQPLNLALQFITIAQ